jgi:hypothetical protein
MTTGAPDPYSVPEFPIVPVFPRKPSLVRGIVYALPLSMLGFVLMCCSICVSTLYRERGSQFPQIYVIRRLPDLCLWPSIVCSLNFGLAAILNFAPTAPMGMFRALIYTCGYAVIGLLTTSVASIAFGLEQQSRASDPWAWARTAIAFAVWISLISAHTARRCR